MNLHETQTGLDCMVLPDEHKLNSLLTNECLTVKTYLAKPVYPCTGCEEPKLACR